MARSKKKQNRGAALKFEMYGILIIIFSVIALAGGGPVFGMGRVGRSLNYICQLLAGRLYFVIPVVFIYIGLTAMIMRRWPRGWSYRKTGALLMVIALCAWLQIDLHQREPAETLSAGAIYSLPLQNLREFLSGQKTIDMYQADLGGGLAGALVFGSLYVFFDEPGSKLFAVALLAIGFLYLTGWSYVEILSAVRRYLAGAGRKANREWKRIAARLKQKRRHKELPPEAYEADDGEEAPETVYPLAEEIDEETYRPHRQPSGKSARKLFMDLILPGRGQSGGGTEEEEAPLRAEEAVPQEPERRPDPETDEAAPRVRDFLQQAAAPAAQETQAQAETSNGELPTPGAEVAPAAAAGDSPQAAEPVREKAVHYRLPPLQLLNKPGGGSKGASADFKANARKLETTLESFGVRAKVVEVVRGPAVTRYEIMPDVGVKVSRIVSLTDDIALALAAKDIRMEAPIPGKSAIGIEVPNTEISIVTLREVMETAEFRDASSKLAIVLGRDIAGKPVVANLARMPHLLVAGATGSGKSVCINCIITSILYKAKPNEVKFLMIDPKMVELNVYNGIPHLLAPVVTDPRRASLALKKVVVEMEKRYELFSKSGTRNIEGYNALAAEKGLEPLPMIVVIVDELADLMMVAASDVEDSIARLAQMARAAGIHLIIATQRPSVDVITGVIKANIPSRIAFGVSSQVDSRTILDSAGAEKLLGRGDMLYLPVGESKPIRVQGAFLSDQEVEAVVSFVRSQEQADYREEMVPELDDAEGTDAAEQDELFDQAAQIVVEARQASVSLLQRRLRIGYNRAARLIDALEAAGIVGPYEGSKPREVLMTPEQYAGSRISS